VKKRHVLELGAGTGLAGFAIACACAPALVTVTEMAGDPVMNLQHCSDVFSSTHASCITACGCNVTACALDWRAPEDCVLDDVDVIIGSDIVYDPELHTMLLHTLRYFMKKQPELKPALTAYLACTIRCVSSNWFVRAAKCADSTKHTKADVCMREKDWHCRAQVHSD
jgi:hypothetical protein